MLTLIFDEPPLPPAARAAGREVNVWADEAGEVFARAFVSADNYRIEWKGLGTFKFAPGRMNVHVRPAGSASRALIQSMFDRVIQPVILQRLGWQALHASGVSTPGGALVFCGQGRSGKSTLAYAIGQRQGYAQFSDDAVVLEHGKGRVRAVPLPFEPSLREPSVEFFGRSRQADAVLNRAAARAEIETQPVRSIFILAQDAAAPVHPLPLRVTQAEAFPLLLTHAHCFDESDQVAMRTMVNVYLDIAASVPVFRLTYKPDFAEINTLIRSVLTHHGASESGHTGDVLALERS